MRIAVFGAGAVGSYFGGRLAQAGESVVFIARGRTLEALRQNGLRVESVSGEPHEQDFAVVCEVASLGLTARGEGSSRRRAEQGAAQRLLDALSVGGAQ